MIYHQQNTIQKELYSIVRMFKNDERMIERAELNGVKVYAPKLNKARVVASIGLIGLCLITPATNWMIIFLIKWGIK